ncbi:uncharacterized protein FIBRA_07184 [Fibroporia radiculosa]|uniref:Uncharacterized protein n=1 Tax=Fibroporia radiculosa TaxID=599839 RepID=J4IBN8_9APHY|nr:uncharacterized protein FIBRA_07184 [Fibroporia radiculosa]CCM04986.1 predicted protein [Fibroporia radiculosa]
MSDPDVSMDSNVSMSDMSMISADDSNVSMVDKDFLTRLAEDSSNTADPLPLSSEALKTAEITEQLLRADRGVRLRALCRALPACPPEWLHNSLIALAQADSSSEAALSAMLLTVKHRPSRRGVPADGDVVPRWDTCGHCRTVYDAGRERLMGECRYHPGALCDDDERIASWSEIYEDSRARRTSSLKLGQLLWTCCGLAGDARGCVVSQHHPKRVSRPQMPT